MDQYAAILASLPGLEKQVEEEGGRKWLEKRRKVVIEGTPYFVIAGDRLASEPEALLDFAIERGLVSEADVRQAAAGQPLPADVETVDVPDQSGDG